MCTLTRVQYAHRASLSRYILIGQVADERSGENDEYNYRNSYNSDPKIHAHCRLRSRASINGIKADGELPP